ncbi:tyrosine-type recombinase/integrase [Saliterribacillus persicus]|uniref:Phage integrase family protein n=1 Tax=Saliterribacillus persicus TaxID=930114 RepID=A0A368X5N3_9BACI|nr:tyrosine-type recombinase/integrase [Saliterribacillus persicus]RCW63009.1 phage integrase family protein [Saliterribacillus persicus]
MEAVDPIKSITQIKQMKAILKKSSMRDHLLFVFGINTGIRIHRLLHLKVEDISKDGKVYEYIDLFETTSEKKQSYFINPILKNTLESYLEATAFSSKDYLFPTNVFRK